MRPCFLLIAILLAFTSPTALAQGGFRNEPDYYPLGGIEAKGIVTPTGKSQGIEIKEVFAKGLGEKSGLQVGDIIIKAAGKKLAGKTDDDVIDMFCALVEKAEAKKGGNKFGKLPVLVLDGKNQKKRKLDLRVRLYPAPSKSDPKKCKKTKKILSEALKFLASRQTGPGNQQSVSNENHAVATASLCGLAWIGSGQKKYATNIAKAAEFVLKNAGNSRPRGLSSAGGKGGANWNQSNWSLSYAAIFLSEYLAQKRRPAVKRRLQEIVTKLIENQEASGGWAHGPGGPNALNYLELEIMSNLALGGIGMAQRVGIQADNAKIVKGFQYVKACTSGGGVAYSPRPGQAGAGDPGRTAGAFWALKQIDKGKGLQGSMAKYYTRQLKELYEGHASPTMHILNGALAAALLGKSAYTKYWKTWRPFFMASRTENGAFGCRPNHESRQMKHHPDRSWGPSFVTAHYVLAMELGQGRFRLLDTLPKRQ